MTAFNARSAANAGRAAHRQGKPITAAPDGLQGIPWRRAWNRAEERADHTAEANEKKEQPQMEQPMNDRQAAAAGRRAHRYGQPITDAPEGSAAEPWQEGWQAEADRKDMHRLEAIRKIASDAEGLDGPALLNLAVSICGTQADVARMTGITENTLTAFKKGKTPSAAQQAAILWGLARQLGL